MTAWLQAQGLAPGDTVSLVMPNGLGTLQLLLGAMHGGFVVNPVNLLSQAEQMRSCLAARCAGGPVPPGRAGVVQR